MEGAKQYVTMHDSATPAWAFRYSLQLPVIIPDMFMIVGLGIEVGAERQRYRFNPAARVAAGIEWGSPPAVYGTAGKNNCCR